MKSVNKLLVLVMLFTLAFAGNAFAAESDYSYIDNGDGTATITGYSGTDTNLVIPSTVDGLTVTSIGDNAFMFSNFTSVTIPEGVTSIGFNAFYSSNSLVSVSLPQSLESIGGQAFSNTGLTSLNIPNKVVEIGIRAFEGTANLQNVTLPNNLSRIEDQLFLNSGVKEVIIPSSVTSIGSQAFKNSGLTAITIPSSVISIGTESFDGASALTMITFESAGTLIPTDEESDLASADSGVKTISPTATIRGYDPSTAKTYAVAHGRTFISLSGASSGFVYTDNLNGTATLTDYNGTAPEDLVIPDEIDDLTVTEIGPSAFKNKGLKSATIPSSVITIGTDAFANNDSTFKIKGESGTAAESYAIANGIPFEDINGDTSSGGSEQEPVSNDVTLTGNIYATVLDFSVPLEVTFVIDPNQSNPQDRFISPVLTVQNLTNSPVKLSIASFEMKQESIDKGFQSVAPSMFTDEQWAKLNKVDSKKLAVGIKANNNWQQLDNANALYANQFSDEVIGTITANGSADFVFEAKHGNAFDKAETIKYTVSFVIELD